MTGTEAKHHLLTDSTSFSLGFKGLGDEQRASLVQHTAGNLAITDELKRHTQDDQISE
jgi:hypothetical protein